ncbi:hypothetical protein KDK95_16860 [Actinospica sp. MGRD01-02]|uniref:Uncharacterized protein n=1 Tax=Actinospica acidithermotolerans TaxID=2828514 RepID=A0A941EHZ5_9ACTN|nr:hypothetical protein [Actinospica acidithermotolerans]MBR7827989.1 hypothetical protein [Actinospica acidithermotolerans]
MRRTSFVGALAAVAIGAVLAFAVNGTPQWINLQQAGLIVLLGGVADLIVRTVIADSPLLAKPAADVAAVVEPLGDPVLDAAGNPVSLPSTAPGEEWVAVEPLPQSPQVPQIPLDPPPSQATPQVVVAPSSNDRAVYERAIRAAEGGTQDIPESEVAVTTITGRPVRPHTRRGFRRRSR